MGSTVQAGEAPVGIYEADNECDAALLPTRIVDEGSKDEGGMLVSGCHSGNGDEDDGEGDQGCPERDCGDSGESLAIAVEEETEDIGQLVSEEYVPRLNDTTDMLVILQRDSMIQVCRSIV